MPRRRQVRGKKCKCTGRTEACGRKCVNLLTDPANCGQRGNRCASGECRHGTCTRDPFDNQCPESAEGQCTRAAVVAASFQAACADRFSARGPHRPCDSHTDCPRGSVCLRGCRDPLDQQPNRCSKPCIPV